MTQSHNPRWKRRPSGSNWGDFGDDDEIGRLNLMTAAKVRQAVGEVVEGLSFCLSLPLDLPGGRNGSRRPPAMFATGDPSAPNMNRALSADVAGASDIMCDDGVTLALQYSTQWDGLCHIGYEFDAGENGAKEIFYYNGWRAGEDIRPHGSGPEAGGARRLGIDKIAMARVQTRGVMIDLERHFGAVRRAIGFQELSEVMTAQDVRPEPGDIICLHTGYGRALVAMNGEPDRDRLREIGLELDGRDPALLEWITRSGLIGIAADNPTVETIRPSSGATKTTPLLPLHRHCLFKLGVLLGEYWWLTDLAEALAERNRSAFLLTAPPLRLPGAAGSPLTPIATI